MEGLSKASEGWSTEVQMFADECCEGASYIVEVGTSPSAGDIGVYSRFQSLQSSSDIL